ncbi:MAG: excinuclease ABC subunit C, partial [Parcubacteria group bacterium]|nr:excinuclease ABC subunit C [Parcubacteria group bacterium]
SMVVFQDGLPAKSQYRRFKIKFNSISDTDMMKEMLARRFSHKNISQKKWPLPDLIIIDGGQGQLNAAIDILKNKKLNIPTISIAKQFEELYSKKISKPIRLSKNSKTLQLIQNIRDEAHRFAITYHKKLREKKLSASRLDNIKGIGEKKRKKLLKRFKTINNIEKAEIQNLEKMLGKKLALELLKNL